MRILLVSPCFPPQHAVASLRTHSFARTWSQAGCQVQVLTTAKRHDQCGMTLPGGGFTVTEIAYPVPAMLERLRAQHRAAPAEQAGPRRHWFGLLRRLRQRTGIFSAVRMPDLTDYWVAPALAWARQNTPGQGWDVVVSSGGPYTAHLVARALKREGRAAIWAADFRDLWTENHLYRGLFPFTLRERHEERLCLREADLIVTVTEELAMRLRRRTTRPVAVVFNGTDPDSFAGLSPAPFFPDDGVRRLVYCGSYYPQGQDPVPLLRGLRALVERRPDLQSRLALAVAGWGGEEWSELARRNGVGHLLQLLGVLPHEEALRLERDATALLLLDWRDPRAGVLTGKVFEYLSAPGPILAVGGRGDSALGGLLTRTGRGLHLGSDEGRIAQALANLTDEPARLAGVPDRAVLAGLTRPAQSLRLLEHIRRMAAQPRSLAA
jgi:hypothetical protein